MRKVRMGARILLLPAALATQPLHAEAIDFGWELALASDYVDRGISQTMGQSALQAGVSGESAGGLFTWLWASNIDYTSGGMPEDGTWLEVDAGIGYGRQLSEWVSIDVSFTRYMMPGTVDGVRYDYNEVSAGFDLGDTSRLELSVSDSIHNSGAASWHLEASTAVALPRAASLDMAAGYFDLDAAYGSAYSWGMVGISRPAGPLDVRLGYHRSSSEAQDIFGETAAGERWVLTLAAEFD